MLYSYWILELGRSHRQYKSYTEWHIRQTREKLRDRKKYRNEWVSHMGSPIAPHWQTISPHSPHAVTASQPIVYPRRVDPRWRCSHSWAGILGSVRLLGCRQSYRPRTLSPPIWNTIPLHYTLDLQINPLRRKHSPRPSISNSLTDTETELLLHLT